MTVVKGCGYFKQRPSRARLENNTSFGSKICFLAAGLKSYVLAIQAQGEEGIGFLLLDQTLNIHLDWRPLNRMNLDALITFLVHCWDLEHLRWCPWPSRLESLPTWRDWRLP
jgi:hypothetical protein